MRWDLKKDRMTFLELCLEPSSQWGFAVLKGFSDERRDTPTT
jgi:hypothetical protein